MQNTDCEYVLCTDSQCSQGSISDAMPGFFWQILPPLPAESLEDFRMRFLSYELAYICIGSTNDLMVPYPLVPKKQIFGVCLLPPNRNNTKCNTHVVASSSAPRWATARLMGVLQPSPSLLFLQVMSRFQGLPPMCTPPRSAETMSSSAGSHPLPAARTRSCTSSRR